ncbi:copper resistance system multicopper oxidase [Pseudophaeobacter sp. C1-32P7]|uniref:copper resistance system multicopper oxidase n=1 Tax=Pseudophaeobacter sp. C1-32P7 TaxID=3098142 RepID=UPI0034D6A74B
MQGITRPTSQQTKGLTTLSIAPWRTAFVGAALALSAATMAQAGTYDITVDKIRIDAGDFRKSGVGYNKSQIPTILRFSEGEEVTLNVTNNLRNDTSIHWHGLILPFDQDGVPKISFDGIKPGETFSYRFPVVQAGTYWFHSHSGFQEPDGAYGAIVIEPKGGETIHANRDYVVQFTDTHPHRGKRIMRNLKMSADYYNRSQRTLQDLIQDSGSMGLKAALEDRKMWGRMRMMPTDIEDVQGFTPMINGQSSAQNWTGLFRPGEKIRLRLINSSAMAYFDVRLPGLKMTVVQADGNDVKPVTVDELRIAVAETYDVVVQPKENRPYSIVAESMGRTAMVRGTLAPREGLAGPVPQMRPKPRLTMADMAGMMGHMGMESHVMRNDTGMSESIIMMPGMDHSQHQMPASSGGSSMREMDHSQQEMAAPARAEPMADVDHSQHNMSGAKASKRGALTGLNHNGHQMVRVGEKEGFYAAGSGLTPSAANGGKFLSYDDLSARRPLYRDRPATREIELRLTGNMERYIWSINGKKLSEAEPLRLKYGERVRFKFVNETMMAHPMHLHGMWTILDTGKGRRDPVKHTVSIAPGTTVYTETEVDATGQWAFHCHLSYHADAGMFRKVIVEGGPA